MPEVFGVVKAKETPTVLSDIEILNLVLLHERISNSRTVRFKLERLYCVRAIVRGNQFFQPTGVCIRTCSTSQ